MVNRWTFNDHAIPGALFPKATVSSKGTVWLMWQQKANACGSTPENEIVTAIFDGQTGIDIKNSFSNGVAFTEIMSLCVPDEEPVGFLLESGADGNFACYIQKNEKKNLNIDTANIISIKAAAISIDSIILACIYLNEGHACLNLYKTTGFSDDNVNSVLIAQYYNVWSVDLDSTRTGNVWFAYEQYEDGRFVIKAGRIDEDTVIMPTFLVSLNGISTMPHISTIDENKACVVWQQEKEPGWHCFRDSVIKIALINNSSIEFESIIPAVKNSTSDIPTAPAAIYLEGCIRVFYKMMRSVIHDIRPGLEHLINDWGWQIHEVYLDEKKNWHGPGIVSIDVGYPYTPPEIVKYGNSKLISIFHACSFDSFRETIHSNRINIGIYNKPVILKEIVADTASQEPDHTIRPRVRLDAEIVQGDKSLKCFFGDLHTHSLVSKCRPEHEFSYADIFKYAITHRKLDFVGISDHMFQITKEEWDHLTSEVDKYTSDGHFIGICGYEGYHHINYFFLDKKTAQFGYDNIRMLNSQRIISDLIQRNDHIDKIFSIRHFSADELKYTDVLCGEYIFDEKLDFVMETVQCKGESPVSVNALLDAGFKFGFIGSSDHCRPDFTFGSDRKYDQSLAGIWTENLDRKSIFDALKARSCFSTNGVKMAVCIIVDDTFMGGICRCSKERTITVSAVPSTKITDIVIYRNGRELTKSTIDVDGRVEYRFTDNYDKNAYYYAVISQLPGNDENHPGIAWTSPVWTNCSVK